MQGYYTIPEIAEMIGVSNPTIYKWREKGILVPDKVTPSKRYFYSIEKVHAFIESMNLEAPSKE